MKNDLISRKAALEILMRYCPDDDGSCSKADVDPREMLDEIENIPAVEAEPVVDAEWDHWGGDEWQCTNCAEFMHTEGSWERPWQKYCPYCGARMDKEADNAQED